MSLAEWASAPQFVIVAIASLLAVVSAMMMVTRRDVVRGALWLVMTLIAVAVLFVTLAADLIAVVQVLVYVGAVVVLFLFVIMLLACLPQERRSWQMGERGSGLRPPLSIRRGGFLGRSSPVPMGASTYRASASKTFADPGRCDRVGPPLWQPRERGPSALLCRERSNPGGHIHTVDRRDGRSDGFG